MDEIAAAVQVIVGYNFIYRKKTLSSIKHKTANIQLKYGKRENIQALPLITKNNH